MGNLINKLKQADDAAVFGQIDDREQAVVDRHRQKAPGGFRRRLADADAKAEIDTRRQQRAYAEQAPPEVIQPAKEMLTNLGDRQKVLETFRKLSPEQRQEALKLAPGLAQQLGDDRGGAVGRTLGAVSRGISHGVSQPISELIGTGGTPEEIEYIRQLDAAASQEFSPARPGDPWYQSGPLQAAEMAPWMATVVGGAGVGRAIATGAAKPVAAQMATRAGLGRATLNAAGKAGELAGITAASFPPQYAQEVDQLKEIGMQDGTQLRLLAAGTAAITGLVEGIVPNPFKTGPVPLTEGAVKAARSYLWEAAKRAPGEMSEEYLQGVTSGLGKTVAGYLDENAEDKSVADAFKNGWEQAKEAALPMAFLLGVPAIGGAGLSAARAQRLQQAMAKGFVSSEDAKELGIVGKNRPERMANAQAELEQLNRPTVGQMPPSGPPALPEGSASPDLASPPGALPPIPPAMPPAVQPPRIPGPTQVKPPLIKVDPPKLQDDEPPLEKGMTRLYHGSATPGRTDGKALFSTHRPFAENYRGKETSDLQYVDVPTEWVNKQVDPDGYGQTVDKGFTWNGELDSSETGPRKTIKSQQPTEATQKPASGSQPVSELDQAEDELAGLFGEEETPTPPKPTERPPQAATSPTTQPGWEIVESDGGKLFRENQDPNLKPSQRISTRVAVDPSENVLATKDKFGKPIPPEILAARQEFVDKAKPGAEFEIKGFPGQTNTVQDDGSLLNTSDQGTKRVMGNVQSRANQVKPGDITWKETPRATPTPATPAVDAETKGAAATPKEATVDRAKSEALTEGFKALPEKGQAAFETEWTKGGTSIKNILYPENKNYRAEFEARTGIKLPKGVGSTFQAVEDWHNAGRPLKPTSAPTESAPEQPPVKPPAKLGTKGAIKPARKMEPTEEGRTADGKPVMPGDRFVTNTGRETTPFPKYSGSSNRQSINTEKKSQLWLMENAIAEAESRGDDFNLTTFRSELETARKGKLPQASKDSATLYVFGDSIPKVPKPITKPLVEKTPKVSPIGDKTPTAPESGTEREPSGNSTGTELDFSISGQSKPIPGMEAEEATYTVHARKPDVIPDTFSVVVAGKPRGKGWSTFKGTGMSPEEAYDRAVRMFMDKRAAETTQPSADQVNVDSGEESKVKPETTAEEDFDAEMEKLMAGLAEPAVEAKPKPASDKPRKPRSVKAKAPAKTAEEKSADDRARAAAKKEEAKRKMREAFNDVQAKPTSGFDPNVGIKVAQATKLYIEAGALDFRAFIRDLVADFGKAWVEGKAPYFESAWRTANKLKWVDSPTGNVTDVLTEIDNVDTTRDDNSEAMGEDATEPDIKPEEGGAAGDVPGKDQPADPTTRGDDEATGSGSTEDSGGNRDGISSPAGSLNNHQIAENPTWLEGGPVKKLNRNIDAITTMNRIEAEKRRATPAEQSIIAGYTGWGHLKQFFVRDSDLRAIKAIQGDKWNLNAFKTLDARTEEQIRDRGRRKGDSEEKVEAKIQREKANNKHRVRLATSMTPAEYAQARKSTRYSHYTDPAIARSMWGFIKNALPEAGKIRILEPSEGSGMFWGTMPDSMFKRAEMHGVDMDPSSSRIAKHLYPSVRHLNIPFQQAPYPKEFVDVAITNVPFNKNPIQDPNEEFDGELSLHNYFFAKTAGRVREGGLVVFITTQFTMDAGNAKQRSIITNQGLKFLGAVRLNQDAFGNVANTKVTTDIIVMQKVAPGSLTTNNTFERAAVPMVAPLGKETAELDVHPYFGSRPGMVAGKITANGEMRGAGPELTVESDMTPEETAAFIEKALAKIEIDKQAFVDGQQHRKDMAEAEQGGTTFVPDHLKGLGLGKLAVDGSNLVVRTSEETMLIVKTEFSPTLKARAESWFAIRDALTNLQQFQTRSDNPESEIEAARKELNRVYDEFVGEFNEKKNDYSNYKPLNTTYNKSMFAADFMSATVQALENTKLIPTGELDKDGKEKTRLRVEKSSIFTERTEWPPEHRPKPKTVKEALAHSMFTNGGVDLDWIATTLDKDKAEVAKQMEEYAFEVPNDGGWEIKEVYLSGNIAKKLEIAEEAATKNPAFTRNVDALRDVLPVPKTFEQLKVYPNSPFLPVDLLRGFVADALGLGAFELYRNDQELGGGWRANYDRNKEINQTAQNLEQYSVRSGGKLRRVGFELFLDMIAGKPTIILDRDADDRTYVNEAATNLAKTKRLDLSRAFDTFIRSSQDRMDAVANEFNKLLSGYVKPSIPDWVVSFDGMSSNWKDLMRSYQKEAAAKIAMGGNTLLAHRVGYGKTLSGVAGIMEQRRLGVARKPLAVVPNHLTGQWAKAFADFYPSAKVMAPTSKDFEKGNRQATMNRIMTGNWDAIIIPESSFKKLPMSSEYVEQFFQEQISQSIDAAERARAEEGGDPRTIAELEDVTERLRNQLAKYLAEAQKDPGPFFDEMGIDSLTVDEAHHYKNLPFYTQNTRVAGINPTGSQQAFDMLMKTDFINALTGSRNVTFLTGTPIANSMTEAWVMMRYLMPETLKEANIFAFDDWKNAFGEVVDRTRVNTIGTGFRTETRFQQFVNLDVLAKMFQQVADIQMINNDVQVPKLKGGKPQSIVVPASDAMKNFMLGLASRSANMPKDPSEDNMLNVMTIGAGAAIDFRLLDAAAMPSETSKITVAADEVAKIFDLTTPFNGTQIIWADRGVPKAAKKLTAEMKQLGAWMLEEVQDRPLTMDDIKAKWKELRPTKNAGAELQRFMGMALQDMNYTTGSEDDEASYKVDMKGEPTVYVNEITDVDPNITEQSAPPWNVYQQMKEELVSRGVPAEKIAFIHDYKTAAQKVQLWDKMNNGDMRVLIGNTPRLGTGANIQRRLVAAHHLDAPWRPADVEQRDGRIIRSGNKVMTIGDEIGLAEQTGVELDGVIINRYVTEGSIDARYWDTNEMKASMLQDFWSGNPGVSIEELGATTLSMSDVKAAAVANPLLKKKIELEHEVNKLSDEYRGAVQSKTQSDSRLKEAQKEVPEAKKKLEAAKKRVAWWNEGKAGLPEGETFGVEIDGEVLFRRDDIAKAIDRKLHDIGRDVPLGVVAKDASDWAKQSFAKSSEERELGTIFGKKITFSVEGGFRNPETGEVVGGNTWQGKALAKELKDGSWERSYNNPMIRVAGIEGLARLGTTSQGFAARIRNFVDPGETWVESHEKALESKEKALSEIEKLNKSIPEPDSTKLVEKQQELEQVSNEIGDEDDDQITYWVGTEELVKTLGEGAFHDQLGRVDSSENILGYIIHPKDGKLSVFNRAGDTRPPAHAMVWVEGENATIGYVPRDEEGVMGLPILKPKRQIGKIEHSEHGELIVYTHKEGDVTQQGKVWVENDDGTQEFGYQDKSLNVVMGVEMQKYEESFGAFPKDVKLRTDKSKETKADNTDATKPKAASEPVAETPKPIAVKAEFMEGANAPGIKQTLRVTAGERTLLMERNRSDGEWSIKEDKETIVGGIVETKKAKEIAQRIIDGTFDKDFDKRFVREDDQNIGMTNAGIAEEIKDQLQRRDSFARLLREHGLVTDGRFLMKVSDKDRDAILKAIGDTFEGTDLSSIKKTMADGQKALSRAANAMKPIGYRGGYLDSRTVVLQSQDGDAMLLDKELHDTILKKYPNAVPYFLDDGQPVSYVDDGDVVAVVMPMSMENPDAKLKSLVSGKYDFEAEAAEAAKFPSQSKTKLKQAAEKANKELADAEKALRDTLRGKLGANLLINPQVVAAAANVVAKAIKAGTLNFAELMERMITKYGQVKAEQMRAVLQQEWDKQVNARPYSEDGIPPKTPQPHPELVQPEAIPLTSVKNAIVDELRVRRGESPMPDVKPQTVQHWLEVAGNRIANDPYAGNTLVEQLLTGNKTSVDEMEGMVLQYHYRAVNNLFEAADAKLTEAKANGNPEDIAIAQDDARVLMRRLAAIETALDKAGTAWGRAGVSRQIFLKQDFSLGSMVRRARVANAGNELSKEQVAIISEQADKIKKLQEKIAELEAKTSEQEQAKVIDDAIKADIEDIKKPVEKPKSKMRAKAEERVATAWKKMRELKLFSNPVSSELVELISAYVDLGVTTFREFMYAAAKNMGAKQAKAAEPTFREAWDQLAADGKVAQPSLDINNPGQLTRFARNVQRTLIENGVTEREEIVDAVHEALQEIIPEITRRQAMDALSSYGQFSQLSKDPIDQIIRDINGQLQQLAKLEDMEQGIAPAKTGVERRSQSDEERRLTQMVNEAKRRGGFVVTDPETQLKSAMAAAKTAVRNRIADMTFELTPKPDGTYSRIVRGKTELIPDAELEQLRKERDELQKVHKEMFPPKGATQAQKIASASRALDAAIASLEAKLAVGDISPAPQPTPLSTPELDAKRARLKQLNAQRDALRKIANPGMTAEQVKIRALDKSIAELEKQLATGNFAPKPKSAPLTSPEINARQAKIEELRATKKAILAAANPKMTPEQRASRAYEAHLRKQLAIYMEKIAQGDFAQTPKKQPRILTRGELDLKKQLADVKNDFFEALAKYHLENLSPGERAIDAIRESAHLSRAIMTSVDLSAVLRQGGLGVYSHPVMAKKAAAEMWHAIWSREAEFQSIEKLRMRPNAQLYEESGLNITDSEGKLTRQEEAFMGRWARTGIDFAGAKVQAASKYALEPVAASARAYVTFINNLRADLFDVMVENLGQGGQVTKEEAQVIASYINVATGRSDWKKLNEWAANMNTVFFAPRYVASRFQYLAMPFYVLGSRKNSGRVKMLIAKEYARTFTGAAVFIGSLTALAYLAAGGDDEEEPSVEFNPLSSDFGKVRIGETRIDPLAGLAQVIVFSSRMAAMHTKNSVTGKVKPFYDGGRYETTHLSEAWRFTRTKLAPVPGAVVTAFSGMENVVGEDVTPAGLVGGLFVPISAGEFLSTMEHRGIPKGLALNVLNLMGASVNTYGPKTAYLDATPEERTKMVNEYIKSMNWESDLPAFSQYLKPEELKQVQNRQDERRGDLVYEAMGTVLPKKDYKTEVHFEEAKERHDKVNKEFEELRKQYAPTITDAIRYLAHHFDSEGGIKMQGTFKLKPSFKERRTRLEKHYQSLPQ